MRAAGGITSIVGLALVFTLQSLAGLISGVVLGMAAFRVPWAGAGALFGAGAVVASVGVGSAAPLRLRSMAYGEAVS